MEKLGCIGLAVALLSACGDNQTHPLAAYDAGAGPLSLCTPNLDGRIDASELPIALGVAAQYLVSPPGQTSAVDVAGTVNNAGQHFWDWSVAASSDVSVSLGPVALGSQWYAASFPEGQFVAPIDAQDVTEGIYQKTDSALLLLGLASSSQNPASGETLIVYNAPIALYLFPLQPGAAWESSASTTHAMLDGLPYAGTDTYDISVDAAGILALPGVEFEQAMRMRITVTVAPAAGIPVVQRQVSFLFECFGEVARATSLPDETQDDFTTASEVRLFQLGGN